MMNRREALSRVAIIMGGTVIGSEAFLTGCKASTKTVSFSKDDIAFLNEVAETILPATNTPGAKEAKVGEFMTVMVNDCYEEDNQIIFMEGMRALKFKDAKAKIGKSFMEASAEERHQLLVTLDAEAKEYQKNKKAEEPTHYFSMIKQLTLTGFFTSEVGATKVLRYVATPGRFDGSAPYIKGE
ncbi:MAG: gluconate 2-dehydrogenase subunit 3 family protein, partial [Sediminibacterium sp.]